MRTYTMVRLTPASAAAGMNRAGAAGDATAALPSAPAAAAASSAQPAAAAAGGGEGRRSFRPGDSRCSLLLGLRCTEGLLLVGPRTVGLRCCRRWGLDRAAAAGLLAARLGVLLHPAPFCSRVCPDSNNIAASSSGEGLLLLSTAPSCCCCGGLMLAWLWSLKRSADAALPPAAVAAAWNCSHASSLSPLLLLLASAGCLCPPPLLPALAASTAADAGARMSGDISSAALRCARLPSIGRAGRWR